MTIHISSADNALFFREFQQIAGLAMQRLTDRDQGRKAYRTDMTVFQLREVDVGDPDLFAELVQSDLSIRHHTVKPYNYFSHIFTYTVSSCSFCSSVPYLKIIVKMKMITTNATEIKSISN